MLMDFPSLDISELELLEPDEYPKFPFALNGPTPTYTNILTLNLNWTHIARVQSLYTNVNIIVQLNNNEHTFTDA